MPDDLARDFRVRPGRATDAHVLSGVARRAKALWGYDPAWLASWQGQLTLTEEDLVRMVVRVVESNGTIVAFGAVDRAGEEWEVAHLWVDPAFTRRGIGRLLLDSLVDAARDEGARRLRIESDPHAESFYLSAGAVRIGAIPAPMPDAPERVLPVLELVLDAEARE